MSISFIVTSFDILPWIDSCLDSVAACARPGDRVIIVDDGSGDGTDVRIRQRAAQGLGEGVEVLPVLLGVNTMGGVGIPANIGLSHALSHPGCETVFFVDGDDWLEPTGFRACRQHYETLRPDLLICGYSEFDETARQSRPASDAASWSNLQAALRADFEMQRSFALKMNSVPWRKFYSADFLRRTGARFPEGDYFFEDNPFHWEVCLKAATIGFDPVVLCQHRMNRPGQTMASTGAELLAFFDHFETIRAEVAATAPARAAEVITWLVTNMHWHLERMQIEALWPYASRASQALAGVPEADWQLYLAQGRASSMTLLLQALREGRVMDVLTLWTMAFQARRQEALMAEVLTRLTVLEDRVKAIPSHDAWSEIERFRAILTLPHPQV